MPSTSSACSRRPWPTTHGTCRHSTARRPDPPRPRPGSHADAQPSFAVLQRLSVSETGEVARRQPRGIGYWGYVGLPLWFAAIGAGMVALAVANFVTQEITVVVVVVGGFVLALGVVNMVILIPLGWRRLDQRRRERPVLEIDATTIRFCRPGQKPLEVQRARVGRIEYRYRRFAEPGTTSSARFYDRHDHQIATWNLYPLLGRAVGHWLRRHDIDTRSSTAGAEGRGDDTKDLGPSLVASVRPRPRRWHRADSRVRCLDGWTGPRYGPACDLRLRT